MKSIAHTSERVSNGFKSGRKTMEVSMMESKLSGVISTSPALRDEKLGMITVQESGLKLLIAAEPQNRLVLVPLFDRGELWWRLQVELPGQERPIRLVDAKLKNRRWRQANAAIRFIAKICGLYHQVEVSLVGLAENQPSTEA